MTDIEDLVKRCKDESTQIKRYDPDPYYVDYFFRSYLNMISRIYDGIFEEAGRNFGLFIPQCNKEMFMEKSIMKNDPNAIKFVSWYEEKIREEHNNHYPALMQKVVEFYRVYKKLPKIKIMIRAKERYKDDLTQEISTRLNNGKLVREDMQIEINRQAPVFLEVINHKRAKNGEPSVSKDSIVASAFFECYEFEIGYATEIYIQVVNRIVVDSREKLRELTTWG